MTINDSVSLCRENFDDARAHFLTVGNSNDQQQNQQQIDAMPIIYFVTPTYKRREQIAELTRLGQTLMHIPRLHWIVADDIDACNTYLDALLDRFGKYTQTVRRTSSVVRVPTYTVGSTHYPVPTSYITYYIGVNVRKHSEYTVHYYTFV